MKYLNPPVIRQTRRVRQYATHRVVANWQIRTHASVPNLPNRGGELAGYAESTTCG
jgi:hypothetical protein